MPGLLDVADVQRGDTGGWTNGYDFDAFGCVMTSKVDDICDPAPVLLSGPDWIDGDDEAPSNAVKRAPVFGVSTYLQQRLLCGGEGDTEKVVRSALDVESEKAVGRVLSVGFPGNDVNLADADVATVTAGANVRESLAKALDKLWDIATGVGADETVIHLGIGTALAFTEVTSDGLGARGLGDRVAVSEGYAMGLLAVTGPVTVHLGDDHYTETVDHRTNRKLPFASRLASVYFDPCHAVRVA